MEHIRLMKLIIVNNLFCLFWFFEIKVDDHSGLLKLIIVNNLFVCAPYMFLPLFASVSNQESN